MTKQGTIRISISVTEEVNKTLEEKAALKFLSVPMYLKQWICESNTVESKKTVNKGGK